MKNNGGTLGVWGSNPNLTKKHRITDAIVRLLDEIREQLHQARHDKDVMRKFGLYGEGAFSALHQIREGLWGVVKHGATPEFFLQVDDQGKVAVEAVHLVVAEIIEDKCPYFDDVRM